MASGNGERRPQRWREERAKLSQCGDLSTSPRGGQGGGSSNDRRGGPQVEMKLARASAKTAVPNGAPKRRRKE